MFIETQADLHKAILKLSTATLIAVDVETDGLNVRKNKVIGLGLYSDKFDGFYCHNLALIPSILAALKGKKLLAWNAYFDLEMIRNNFNVDLWEYLHADVVCLKHTVDEERPFGLKEVSKSIYGTDATKEQDELKASIKKNGGQPKQFYKADPAILGKYCIKDCELTYKLFKHYSKMLEAENLESFFYKDEVMPLYKEVTRFMQSNGIPVDVIKLQKMQKSIIKDIDDLESKIQDAIKPHLEIFNKWFMNKDYKPAKTGSFAQAIIEYTGVKMPKTPTGRYSITRYNLETHEKNKYIQFLLGNRLLNDQEIKTIQDVLWKNENKKYMFNLQSKFHLKKLFFETLNEKATTHTNLGSPQINESFLDKMASKYQWAGWIQDYNKLSKLKSTYIERILEKQENGIFYPEFHQHRTISGRYGSDLQQLPRLAEQGQFSSLVLSYRNQIRTVFIAGPDHSFVDDDYESLEPHIFAHVSNEQKIKDIFLKGHDFYSTIAIETEGLKDVSADKASNNYLGKVNKKLRQRAKAYSLGIPYGMEDYALSRSLNIEQEDAKSLIRNYLSGFPALKKWMEESNDAVLSHGYVTSQAGRKRRFKKAQRLLKKHGAAVLDSLYLYQQYSDNAKKYNEMKEVRRVIKNALNNAKNFQIQSLAASIVNRACIQINRELKQYDAAIVAQIHDQIIVKCKKSVAKQVQSIVQSVMETVYKISIPLKAPAEIADNFAEGH